MATRRLWTLEQKRTIIAEYDDAPHGTKAAVLRGYNISNERVREWRAARDAGLLEVGGVPRKLLATSRADNAEIRRLRRENERLEHDLTRARQETADRQGALDALGKATALLHELVSSKSASVSSPVAPSSSSEPTPSQS